MSNLNSGNYSDEHRPVAVTKSIESAFGLTHAEALYYYILWKFNRRIQRLVEPGKKLQIHFTDNEYNLLKNFIEYYDLNVENEENVSEFNITYIDLTILKNALERHDGSVFENERQAFINIAKIDMGYEQGHFENWKRENGMDDSDLKHNSHIFLLFQALCSAFQVEPN